MKCPTEKQVLEAAKCGGIQVRIALSKLFPEAFTKPIQIGEIYSWGTAPDGGSGLVIQHPEYLEAFAFINFCMGTIFLSYLTKSTTKSQLNVELSNLPSKVVYNCYSGDITGPTRLHSWVKK